MNHLSNFLRILYPYSVTLYGFVMAVSNAFGLFMIIIFLGFGLVELPLKHQYRSNLEDYYQF